MKPEDRPRTYRRMDAVVIGLMKLGTGLLLADVARSLAALELPHWWAFFLCAWASWFAVTGLFSMVVAFLPIRILERLLAWTQRRRQS